MKEVVNALGVEDARLAPTPRVTAEAETKVEGIEGSIDPEMGPEETSLFRAVAARLDYFFQNRPEITFATMKLCSEMSRPDAQHLKSMKRVGGILV